MTKETVLLVDDSPDILDSMQMVLELGGYQVLTATSEQQMNEILDVMQPEVIILDIFIAGADGRELCRQLKAKPCNSALKIILTSAAPHVLQDYQLHGADEILEKPFGLDEVYAKLSAARGRQT